MNLTASRSHLNGLEHLLMHYPLLWDEVQSVIANVDAEMFRASAEYDKKLSATGLYSAINMVEAFKLQFSQLNWEAVSAHQASGEHGISGGYSDYLIKGRVALGLQLERQSELVFDLFVKHLAFYVGDVIDVGIEIVPMKVLQDEMSSGVPYYEGELYNLIREGRGVPAVPLVLIGIAP